MLLVNRIISSNDRIINEYWNGENIEVSGRNLIYVIIHAFARAQWRQERCHFLYMKITII